MTPSDRLTTLRDTLADLEREWARLDDSGDNAVAAKAARVAGRMARLRDAITWEETRAEEASRGAAGSR